MPSPSQPIQSLTYTTPVPTSLGTILTAFDSVGPHIASKLQLFNTHEETLTDELCDMFYVWVRRSRLRLSQYAASVFQTQFTVTIKQSTKRKEADFGYDLAIRLRTPEGVKFALLQSKVFDPVTTKLRCASKRGWRKLKRQLKLMRLYANQWGDNLVCLAVYMPASHLFREQDNIGTWEQQLGPQYGASGTTDLDARYGVSILHYGDLIGGGHDWRHDKRVAFVGTALQPDAGTLSELIVDMLLCKRGDWRDSNVFPDDGLGPDPEYLHGFLLSFAARRQIDVTCSSIGNRSWEGFCEELRENTNAG